MSLTQLSSTPSQKRQGKAASDASPAPLSSSQSPSNSLPLGRNPSAKQDEIRPARAALPTGQRLETVKSSDRNSPPNIPKSDLDRLNAALKFLSFSCKKTILKSQEGKTPFQQLEFAKKNFETIETARGLIDALNAQNPASVHDSVTKRRQLTRDEIDTQKQFRDTFQIILNELSGYKKQEFSEELYQASTEETKKKASEVSNLCDLALILQNPLKNLQLINHQHKEDRDAILQIRSAAKFHIFYKQKSDLKKSPVRIDELTALVDRLRSIANEHTNSPAGFEQISSLSKDYHAQVMARFEALQEEVEFLSKNKSIASPEEKRISTKNLYVAFLDRNIIPDISINTITYHMTGEPNFLMLHSLTGNVEKSMTALSKALDAYKDNISSAVLLDFLQSLSSEMLQTVLFEPELSISPEGSQSKYLLKKCPRTVQWLLATQSKFKDYFNILEEHENILKQDIELDKKTASTATTSPSPSTGSSSGSSKASKKKAAKGKAKVVSEPSPAEATSATAALAKGAVVALPQADGSKRLGQLQANGTITTPTQEIYVPFKGGYLPADDFSADELAADALPASSHTAESAVADTKTLLQNLKKAEAYGSKLLKNYGDEAMDAAVVELSRQLEFLVPQARLAARQYHADLWSRTAQRMQALAERLQATQNSAEPIHPLCKPLRTRADAITKQIEADFSPGRLDAQFLAEVQAQPEVVPSQWLALVEKGLARAAAPTFLKASNDAPLLSIPLFTRDNQKGPVLHIHCKRPVNADFSDFSTDAVKTAHLKRPEQANLGQKWQQATRAAQAAGGASSVDTDIDRFEVKSVTLARLWRAATYGAGGAPSMEGRC